MTQEAMSRKQVSIHSRESLENDNAKLSSHEKLCFLYNKEKLCSLYGVLWKNMVSLFIRMESMEISWRQGRE